MDVWDIYFSGLVGWSLHPGYLRDGARSMTLDECADLADKMCEVRKCRGLPQEPRLVVQ